MTTACAVVVVATMVMTIRIDAQWVVAAARDACTGGAFVVFVSTK
jgi:hypothetical protein